MKKETTKDIKVLRKTVLIPDQEQHKKNKQSKKCPYRIVHKWDSEKNKYVKVKIYKTRTKMNRKELKEFFGHSFGNMSTLHEHKVRKQESANAANIKSGSQRKPVSQPARKVKLYKISGIDYTWDNKNLCYKKAA